MISSSRQEGGIGFIRSSVASFCVAALSLVIFLLFTLLLISWPDTMLQAFSASLVHGLILSGAEIVIAVGAIISGYQGYLSNAPQSRASTRLALAGIIIGYVMILITICSTFSLIMTMPYYKMCILQRCT
jgi:hypothetical protein